MPSWSSLPKRPQALPGGPFGSSGSASNSGQDRCDMIAIDEMDEWICEMPWFFIAGKTIILPAWGRIHPDYGGGQIRGNGLIVSIELILDKS